MKLKTTLRAGNPPTCDDFLCTGNHNQTLAQGNKPKPMKLKTHRKAGAGCPDFVCGTSNHNQTLSPRR